jgi:probable HAF family extracellular repeat protein
LDPICFLIPCSRHLGGSFGSSGYGINNTGQVTGISYLAGNAQHAFLYSNGTMSDLGTLGGTDSAGLGINNAGQVTGSSDITGNKAAHAFLYSSGTMSDLNSLIAPGSGVTAIDMGSGGNHINDWG